MTFKEEILTTIILGLGLLISLYFMQCVPPPVCTPLQARCIGNRIELCDSAKQWQEVIDCNKLASEQFVWQCKTTPETTSCFKESR